MRRRGDALPLNAPTRPGRADGGARAAASCGRPSRRPRFVRQGRYVGPMCLPCYHSVWDDGRRDDSRGALGLRQSVPCRSRSKQRPGQRGQERTASFKKKRHPRPELLVRGRSSEATITFAAAVSPVSCFESWIVGCGYLVDDFPYRVGVSGGISLGRSPANRIAGDRAGWIASRSVTPIRAPNSQTSRMDLRVPRSSKPSAAQAVDPGLVDRSTNRRMMHPPATMSILLRMLDQFFRRLGPKRWRIAWMVSPRELAYCAMAAVANPPTRAATDAVVV